MATVARKKPSPRYLALIENFPLMPIGSKAELRAAQTMIDGLLRKALHSDEQAYLDVLTQLVEVYENEHEPIEASTPSELLAFLMEARGVNSTEVSSGAGIAPSIISDIRTGTRSLSKANCRDLAAYFRVSPLVFLEAMLVPEKLSRESKRRPRVTAGSSSRSPGRRGSGKPTR
jgi:HTH-type transcriptional regulator / antitoxin HigA